MMLALFFFTCWASTALAAPQALASPASTGAKPEATSGEQSYKCYKGTDFPATSEWLTFESLLAINGPTLKQNLGSLYDNVITDIGKVATQASILPELVLADIMQETGGAAAFVGDAGKSFGLMQVQPLTQKPITCSLETCTPADILGMIQQGVNGQTGTSAPAVPGLAYYLTQYGYGPSLRWYNTGHLPDAADLSVASPISTSSYVSDVANRLMGIDPKNFPSPDELVSLCGFPKPDSS